MTSKEDLALAQKAVQESLITPDELAECVQHQQALAAGGQPRLLLRILLEKGYLTTAQIHALNPAPRAGGAADGRPPAAAPRSTVPAPAHPTAATAPAHPLAHRPSSPRPPVERPSEANIPVVQPLPTPQAEALSAAPASGPRPATGSHPPAHRPPSAPPPAPARPAPAHAGPRPAAAAAPNAGRPASSPPAPGGPANPKEPVPGYKVMGKIGAGGMAVVFKAERAKTGQIVALKIMYPQHVKVPLYLNRFLREAKLLSEFEHENIVRGYDYGSSNGLYWVAMEFIEGRSVQSLIDAKGTLGEEEALSILLQIAKALDYAQNKGILHRDIKPDNILITPEGVVKLCDLGFAKPIGVSEEEAGDSTCGTPQYMSPEQAQGARDLDIRSDIYALGATLFHMITGDVPFKGTDNMEVMAKQVLEELKSSDMKNRKISRHMHYFIEKMMAKEKELRYESPREVIDEIGAQVEGYKSLQFNPDAQESTKILEGLGEAKESPRRPVPARPDAHTAPRAAPAPPRSPLSPLEQMRRKRMENLTRRHPPPPPPAGKGKYPSDPDTGFHFGRKK